MARDNYWTTTFRKRYSRRGFLGMAAAASAGYAGLSLIGCGGGKASPEAASTATTKTPKYGGTLHWFDPGAVPDMDPFDYSPGGVAQRGALGVVYDQLMDYDWSGDLTFGDGKIIPRLAESFTMPDPTTYVFKLRQNVKWHDGVEFTSADVKFSYDFIMDPPNKAPGATVLDAVSKVEATDKFTVKITLKRPSAPFQDTLTQDSLPITPKHIAEKDRKGLAMKPVGTGPFMVEKLDPKTGVTYKKNPNYYIPGKPYLDGMTMALIQDWSAKAAAFMSKEIDFHIVDDQAQYDAIKAVVRDHQLRPWPGASNPSLQFNYTKAPFNDIRVRKAVYLGIDHKGLLDRLYGGQGAINPPVIAATMKDWALPPEELAKFPGFRQPKTQDIAEAKRLLAEAGYANGLTVSAICDATLTMPVKNIQVVADHLRAVGITISVECVEPAMYSKRANAGEFDIYMRGLVNQVDDPDRRLFNYQHTRGTLNKGKLSDPKLDEMIEKQAQALNKEERRKIIQDIQRYMIEQAYNPPTPNGVYYGLLHSYVRGYDPAYTGVAHPQIRGEAQDIWLDK